MGQVYQATDTLDRTVAIKVLPEHVAADNDLKRRMSHLRLPGELTRAMPHTLPRRIVRC